MLYYIYLMKAESSHCSSIAFILQSPIKLCTCSGGIPNSCLSFLCAALFTPTPPSSSSSVRCSGWLQHVFVKHSGNVIFSLALCCNSSLLSELNKKTLKARCSLPAAMFTFKWQFFFVSEPIAWSSSSTRMHFSESNSTWVSSKWDRSIAMQIFREFSSLIRQLKLLLFSSLQFYMYSMISISR